MGDQTNLRRFGPFKILFSFAFALIFVLGAVGIQSGPVYWGGLSRDVRMEMKASLMSLRQDAHGIQEQLRSTKEGVERIWRSVHSDAENLKTRG